MSNELLYMMGGSAGGAGEPAPEGVSFDGVNDYLSRGSDLVGNTDSKTFTLSCWVYWTGGDVYIYSTDRFYVYITSLGRLTVSGSNSGGNQFRVDSVNGAIKTNTFIHILISVDLTNTLSRYLYLNDINISASSGWSPYNNALIDFTITPHTTGAFTSGSSKLKGRLSHLFLAYEYVDLSVESNRRMFITADGKPSDGLAALNPILYLPMRDADTAHINEGTGGDFVPNGVLDTAQRGANQNNCVASKFNGSTQYLSSTGISGATDSKTITFSALISLDNTSGAGTTQHVLYQLSGASLRGVQIRYNASGSFSFDCYSSTGQVVSSFSGLAASESGFLKGRQLQVCFSFDTSSATLRHVMVNNRDVTSLGNFSNYIIDGLIGNSAPNVTRIGTNDDFAQDFKGSLGEFYFDTNYIDLATDNPFWDATLSRPKPVRQVLEETGNTPLIAMPISADNPTLNLGTGGNFTLNGGGLTGARGASEFIARSADLANGSSAATGVLYRNGSLSASDSKTATLVIAFLDRSVGSEAMLSAKNAGLNEVVQLFCGQGGGSCVIRLRDSVGQVCFDSISTLGLSNGAFSILMLNVDVSVSSSNLFVDGQSVTDTVSYQNNNIDFSGIINTYVGSNSLTPSFEGQVCFIYLSNSSVDFSLEENRNLFVDQLGYPKDLSKQIVDGLIPEPLIYLPFDDPTNLGKNLGTGGDFQINGTVTLGSDFSI